jgi:hypothetical protein
VKFFTISATKKGPRRNWRDPWCRALLAGGFIWHKSDGLASLFPGIFF